MASCPPGTLYIYMTEDVSAPKAFVKGGLAVPEAQALRAELVQMFKLMIAHGLTYGGFYTSSNARSFQTAQSYEKYWTKLCLIMDAFSLVINNWNVLVTEGLRSDFQKCMLHYHYAGLLRNNEIMNVADVASYYSKPGNS